MTEALRIVHHSPLHREYAPPPFASQSRKTQSQLGIAKEKPGALIHVLRFLVNKQLLPTKVFVYEGDNPDEATRLFFSIQRGVTFFRSKVDKKKK